MKFNIFQNKSTTRDLSDVRCQMSDVRHAGFTLIEIIITIAILSFGIIGVYGAFHNFAVITRGISLRFTGVTLTQEGLEIIRNMRDNNFIRLVSDSSIPWYDGLTGCENGCQADYKTGTAAAGSENQLSAFNPNDVLRINSDGLYSYDLSGTPTKFQREIIINHLSDDVLKVTVQVSWNYNNVPSSISTQEYLYNWY